MTDISSEPAVPARTLRRRISILLYAGSWPCFLLQLYFEFQSDASIAVLFSNIAWGICLTLWCRMDAILAERPLPTMSIWVVLLFWPIAVPACVIRIYGLLYGLLLVFLHVMIYAVAYAIPVIVTMMEQY